ncbi:clavesin-1-like isoform X2 [Zerene cesonia]|uniref:clavesin-1-like isoform X2 n=1 Tax=Zerene cesonia TaxID=33412 RepID=UPI0018E53E2C|nr:clavesin-1-like isoform X2 [Zerene cesonia]
MFREIAFRAELDRHIVPECEDQARILCGEDPDNRKNAIKELRDMILERGECIPPRLDDAFLLRFLRARRSIPARAHRLLVRYCRFREQNPRLWKDVYWYGLARLGNIFEGVLYDRPDVGRLIIGRLGKWDPDTTSAEELVSGMLLLLEVGIMQPKLQVLGGTALLDCDGMTLYHMRQLTPTVAVQAMNVMGYSFPLHQRGVHVINCSRIIEKLFYLFKRLAPVDAIWKNVYFHGYDNSSLHRYIDPECLPKRYGGYREAVSLGEWLTAIKQYKDDNFDKDMSSIGYGV